MSDGPYIPQYFCGYCGMDKPCFCDLHDPEHPDPQPIQEEQ